MEPPDLTGKTCVITGATSGIGRSAALALGCLEANLILVGRNERAGHDVVRLLQRRTPSARFQFIRSDLSQLTDVRALAATIARDCDLVDVLMNNAGARFDSYHKTNEGIELTFATNYLGHFLLTCLLSEQLARAPAARVITVSSGGHFGASGDGEWYFGLANYDRRLAYAKSKLANVLFAYELARRLTDTRVTSNAVDPGGVASNFSRNNGLVSWVRHLAAHALRRQLTTPRKGAETLVYLAVSEQVRGVTGRYFRHNREVESSVASHNLEQARRLWDLSVDLTDLKNQSAPTWAF